MNIREVFSSAEKSMPNYFDINREERNYAAILYAALCKPGNTEAFLELCGHNKKRDQISGVYFEYAYLRDLWKDIGYGPGSNDFKKDIIRKTLDIKSVEAVLTYEVMEINKSFGVGGRPSKDHIQYPGKWSAANLATKFTNPEDFLTICKYKWEFNIKPDIVIHVDKRTAICIETKYESGESQYPASRPEKKVFNDKKLQPIGQMDLQKYMMEKLLGLDAKFILVGSKNSPGEAKHKFISWKTAFSKMKNMSDMHHSVVQMANNPKLGK
jgi:hypothetical protein